MTDKIALVTGAAADAGDVIHLVPTGSVEPSLLYGSTKPGLPYTEGATMEPPAQAHDPETRAALWELLQRLTR
jgi:hypothetical protein